MRASSGETPLTSIDAGGRLLEVGDDAEQRGLAAAGRADQRDEVAGLDVEVDVRQRLDRPVGGLEGQRKVADVDDRGSRVGAAATPPPATDFSLCRPRSLIAYRFPHQEISPNASEKVASTEYRATFAPSRRFDLRQAGPPTFPRMQPYLHQLRIRRGGKDD